MYTKLYYNADSQMLIDQIFEEITLLQGRNLTPPPPQNKNHLDWQGESSELAFWEK